MTIADNTRHKTAIPDELWRTEDVMKYIRKSRQYVSMLCSTGKIPYIPGKPKLFVPDEVKLAMVNKQVGGRFGKIRRKTL